MSKRSALVLSGLLMAGGVGAQTPSLLGALASPPPNYLASMSAPAPTALFSAFTPGNLVISQVGADGSGTTLTSSSFAAFLKEYTTGGTAVGNIISLPTSLSGSNQPITASGTAVEGFVTRSYDGTYLSYGGYATGTGTATVNSSTVSRVIARINSSGSVDTTTSSNMYSGSAFRSVTSVSGGPFWTAGNSTSYGTSYVTYGVGSTATLVTASPTNCRVSNIFNGQLYLSTGSAGFNGVNRVGSGIPTTTGNTTSLLTGFPGPGTPSAYDFHLASAEVLYVADDRATASGGGLQKWIWGIPTPNQWNLAYTLNTSLTSGLRSVCGTLNASGNPVLYCTSADTLPKLVVVTDTGSGSAFTTLATSGTNTAFRGVDFAPANTAPTLVPGNVSNLPSIGTNTSGSGATVLSILSGGSAITGDDSGALMGIAITGLAGSAGSWSYSVDGGTNWTPVGNSISNSKALLLPVKWLGNDVRLRYASGATPETATLTFRAWDQTCGTPLGTVSSGTITLPTHFGFDCTNNGGVYAVSSATATVNCVVSSPNTPPTANSQSVNVNEDGSLPITLTATDPDSGQTLTYSIVTPPTSGNLSGTAPNVTYTPNADVFSPPNDSFTFKANDGLADSNIATVTITINPVNDQPSFSDLGSQTCDEDTGAQSVSGWAHTFVFGPANESGQAVLSFSATNDNNALFSVQPAVSNTGTLSFTPAPDAHGTATVHVKLRDDGGTANGGVDESVDHSFTITVNSVNDVPSFTKGADQTVDEDSGAASVTGWATAISAGPANESSQVVDFLVTNDNNALFSAQPAVSASGDLTFTPAANANGTATVTVRIHDDGGTANGGVDTSAAQTFTITVNSVNDAPVLDPVGNKSGSTTHLITFTVTASDLDMTQTLTFSLDAGAPAGASMSSGGVFTWTPTAIQDGDFSVTLRVTDNGSPALSDMETITIHVAPTPIYHLTDLGANASVAYGVNNFGEVVGTHRPGSATQAFCWSNGVLIDLGTLNANNAEARGINDAGVVTGYRYWPTAGDAFVYSNGAPTFLGTLGGTFSQGFAINSSGNVAGISTLSGGQNRAFLYSGGPLQDLGTLGGTYSAAYGLNDSGQVVGESRDASNRMMPFRYSGGVMTSLAEPQDHDGVAWGINSAGHVAGYTSDTATGATHAFLWTPTGRTDLGTGGQQHSFAYSINDSDQVVGSLTGPAVQSGFIYSGGVMFDLNDLLDVSGTGYLVRIAFSISNTGFIAGIARNSGGQQRAVLLTPINPHAPVLAPIGNQTVNELVQLSFVASATDPDAGDTITFSLGAGAPAGASITSDGTFTWTPTEAQGPGDYPVKVIVKDAANHEDSETITVHVNEVNVAPTANAQSLTVSEDSSSNAVTLTGSDPDLPANTLTFSVVTPPLHGSLSGTAPNLSYTPTPDYAGADSYTFKINDGTVDGNTATVSITVSSVNDAPVIAAIGTQYGYVGYALSFTANGSDPHDTPPNAISYSLTGAPAGASINPSTGVFSWTPTSGQLGDHTFTVVATDDGNPNLSASTSVLVHVGKAGTVYAWGKNANGQLGDGTHTDRNAPVPVPNMEGFVQVAGGQEFSLALKADGTVWAWGKNDFGQLGDGTTISHDLPAQVSGLGNVVKISAGMTTSFAITASGQLYAWGYNGEGGFLGDGTNTDRHSPVLALISDVAQVEGSGSFTMARKTDGTVWTWGNNSNGQLGQGTSDVGIHPTPTQVMALSSITDIAASGVSATALRSDGTVYCWGYNGQGQIGNGTTIDALSPVAILSGAIGVHRGQLDASATMSDGSMRAWGSNGFGQLGDGTTIDRLTPVAVSLSNVSTIASGSDHTTAVLLNGSLYAWGLNGLGQVGNGTTANQSLPVSIALPHRCLDVSAGYRHTIALVEIVENTPPVATDDSYGTNEDTLLSPGAPGVLFNDSDPGDTMTAELVSGPAHAASFTLHADGSFEYMPAPEYSGPDSFTYQAKDSVNALSNVALVSITVAAVNDVPSFTKGADQTVNEDSGAASVTGWATAISAGPANESSQAVDFVVTNDNNALFSAQPAVSASGDLTFTPAANANGTCTVSVKIHDDGGTANGGVDTSAAQTFTITVNSVNDEPSFVKGADQTVDEDAAAQSVSGWATAISAGPSDESGQALTFEVTNDNNSLFSVQPAVSAAGTLTFTPAADAFGTATVNVTLKDDGGTANGGDDTSATQTFTITVNSVNDRPSFSDLGDQTCLEDAAAQSVSGWAHTFVFGPANESGQTVDSFIVTNDNNALFSVQPAVSNSGTLTFTPAADANGTATIHVRLKDNGGTANGGDDTSVDHAVTITVTAVNDVPSFTKGADQTVAQDSGAHSVSGWATAISPGPADESSQVVDFLVSNDNNALFSSQPTVSPSGTLSFTPAAGMSGSATVSVRIHDDGGIANGGVDTSGAQTFTITVNANLISDVTTAFPVDLVGPRRAPAAEVGSAGLATSTTDSRELQVFERSAAVAAQDGTFGPFNGAINPPQALYGDFRGAKVMWEVSGPGVGDPDRMLPLDGPIGSATMGQAMEFGYGHQAYRDDDNDGFWAELSLDGSGLYQIRFYTDGSTPLATFTAPNLDNTRFQVSMELNGLGDQCGATIKLMNGTGAGTVSNVGPLALDSFDTMNDTGLFVSMVSFETESHAVATVQDARTTAGANRLYVRADVPWVKSSGAIQYRVGMANMNQPVRGYFHFLDAAGPQTFVSGAYTNSPFPNWLVNPITAALDLAANDGGGSPTSGNDDLATLVFQPSGVGAGALTPRVSPPSPIRYVDVINNGMPAFATASNTVVVDDMAPSCSISATEGATDVIPGGAPAKVGSVRFVLDAKDLGPGPGGSGLGAWPSASLTLPDTTVVPLQVVAGEGNKFVCTYSVTPSTPCGVATLSVSLVDRAGNVSVTPAAFTINVAQIAVNLQLASFSSSGPVTRGIRLVFGGNGTGSNTPLVIERNIAFSTTGFASLVLDATDGVPFNKSGFTEAYAKDPKHTLGKKATMSNGGNSQYSVSLTLTGGNANTDNVIDVLDFGLFASRYGQNLGANTLLGHVGPHPDFSGNGTVGTEDFTFISAGFLISGDSEPGNFQDGGDSGRETVSIREMWQAGVPLPICNKMDQNRDGKLTVKEVQAYWERIR